MPRRNREYKMVSIHAPREGERLATPITVFRPMAFQSTLPARGSDMR